MKFKIKEVRQKRGFTQTELARRAGVTRVMIWALESSKWEDVSVGNLYRIAAVLGCKMDDLVEDE